MSFRVRTNGLQPQSGSRTSLSIFSLLLSLLFFLPVSLLTVWKKYPNPFFKSPVQDGEYKLCQLQSIYWPVCLAEFLANLSNDVALLVGQLTAVERERDEKTKLSLPVFQYGPTTWRWKLSPSNREGWELFFSLSLSLCFYLLSLFEYFYDRERCLCSCNLDVDREIFCFTLFLFRLSFSSLSKRARPMAKASRSPHDAMPSALYKRAGLLGTYDAVQQVTASFKLLLCD